MPCFPSLSELPEPPDAVVVAIPAAGVAAVVDEAGADRLRRRRGVRRGIRRDRTGRGARARAGETARRHDLPVCGPNGNGIVAVHERVALWGDALRPLEAGRVALVSQSGNVAVNALNTRRGLRLHTVISCGNSAVLEPAEWIAQLAREEGVRLHCRVPGGRRRRRPARAARWPNALSAAWGCPCSRWEPRRGVLSPPRRTPVPWPGTSACSEHWWRRPARPGPRMCTSCSSWRRPRPCRPLVRGPQGRADLRCSPARAGIPPWPPTTAPATARTFRRSRRPPPAASASCCPTPPRSGTRSTTRPSYGARWTPFATSW